MYGNEYKDKKSDRNLKDDKSQKIKIYYPYLEIPKENIERKFTPSISQNIIEKERKFTPFREKTKELNQENFTPSLTISKKTESNFIPSFEMPKESKREFIPSYDLTGYKKDQKKMVKVKDNIIELKEGNKKEIDVNKSILKGVEKAKEAKKLKDIFIPEKNKEFAEMVGIILGDGNLYTNENQHKHYLRIYFNRVEEKEYNSYVNQQIENIFKITPRIEDRKKSAGTALIVENKAIVRGLIETGLQAGDKVENQVGVPKWVKMNKQNKIGCIRGLFDTDGSIYMRNNQNAIGINFKSGSHPLVKDFKEMCESLDIKTQKIPKPKIYINPDTEEEFKAYQVTIEDKSQITKFINIIQPKKWEYRAEILGLALLLSSELKGKNIVRSIVTTPLAISPIVAALIWRLIFNPQFGILGSEVTGITWLEDPRTALISAAIVDIWQWTPFVFLIL
ncbi:MAG: LAGLIDADG family homing endonuclease, partial [Promethearchaeota archaeon]